MTGPGRTTQAAEDILAIHDVVVRYGFVVDDRQWDEFDGIFTEDAIVDFRDHRVSPPVGLSPIVGREEIVRQFRDVLTHPLQHMLVSVVLDAISDDEVVARSKALFPTPGQGLGNVVYRDIVIRTGRGWRIKHKSIQQYGDEAPEWSKEQFELWKARGARFE